MRRGVLAWPFLGGVIFLVGLPFGLATYLAFTEYYGFASPRPTGWANVQRLLDDDLFWTSLRNAGLIALLVVPLRLLLATGCALLLCRRTAGAAIGRAAVYLPSVVPDAAWALVWMWLLNPIYGPLSLILQQLGVPSPGWFTDPTAARVAVALVVGLQLGETFVVALAARSLVPARLFEVAAAEGASSWYTFRRVTLPLMAPILALLALRDALLVLQTSFVPALLLTDGDPNYATLVSPLYVYRRAFLYGDLGYASTLSLALLTLTALAVAAQVLVLRRRMRLQL